MNLLPNTRWQINSALGLVAKPNIAGTGAMPAISVSSYTTGATAITANCGSTGELKTGDLLSFSGAHDYLQIATLAVNKIGCVCSVWFSASSGPMLVSCHRSYLRVSEAC